MSSAPLAFTDDAADIRNAVGLSPASTMAIGAVAGLALGYLYFTDDGRRLRARIEPMLDAWLGELSRVRATADKARLAYTESRDSLAVMTRAAHARRDV